MKKDKIFKAIGVMAGISGVALSGILLESRREMKDISITEYEIADDRIAEAADIVIISDLHNHDFGDDNRKLIEKIDDLKPDMIFAAGDMIMGKAGCSSDTAMALIKSLGRRYPLYIGRGNHELRADCYRDRYGDIWEQIYAGTREYAHWLINDSIYLDRYNITISGLDISPRYYKRFRLAPMSADYIEQLLGPADDDSYNIMLAHNPDYFPLYSAYGADLSIAGHVHGGMIILPVAGGLLSPMVRFFPRYYKGLYEYDGRQMIVSAGLGNHTLKLRVNNRPEIIRLRLKPVGGSKLEKNN